MSSVSSATSNLPDREDLLGRVWTFGQLVGRPLSDVWLSADGRIIGSQHSNESSWAMEMGALVFRDSAGSPSTVFESAIRHGDQLVLIGRFRDSEQLHYLRERARTDDGGYIPEFARMIIRDGLDGVDSTGVGRHAPWVVDEDRYVRARLHLMSLATGSVFPRPSEDSLQRAADLMAHFIASADSEGLDGQDLLQGSIKDLDAGILHQLVATLGAANCLQIGAFVGYSAALIADAMRGAGGGVLHSVDPDIPHRSVDSPADFAQRTLAGLGLSESVLMHVGWASCAGPDADSGPERRLIGQEVVSSHGPFDLVFIDADHSSSATIADFMLVKESVRPGGCVVFHDALSWPTVTRAVELILTDNHYGSSGALSHWTFDLHASEDGIAVLRRNP